MFELLVEWILKLFVKNRTVFGVIEILFFLSINSYVLDLYSDIEKATHLRFECNVPGTKLACLNEFNTERNLLHSDGFIPKPFYWVLFAIHFTSMFLIAYSFYSQLDDKNKESQPRGKRHKKYEQNEGHQSSDETGFTLLTETEPSNRNCENGTPFYKHLCKVYPTQIIVRLAFFLFVLLYFAIRWPHMSTDAKFICPGYVSGGKRNTISYCTYLDHSKATRLNFAHFGFTIFYLLLNMLELWFIYPRPRRDKCFCDILRRKLSWISKFCLFICDSQNQNSNQEQRLDDLNSEHDPIKDYKTRCIKKLQQWHVPVLKSKSKMESGKIIRSFDYELRNRKEYNVELVVVDSEYEEQSMANELFNYRNLVGLAAGSRIELKDLMRGDDQRYFIRGVAGIGKTTLAEWINFAWANNDLYSDIFDFVFLLRCRDLRLYKGKTIDEFWHDNFGVKIEDLHGQSNKILIIVDGIDEIDDLGKQLNELTILRNLLDKDFDPLLGHSTIITGRPHKEEELMKNQSITGKLRTLSIVGFSESEIKKFVGNFTSGDEDVKREIFDALENNRSLDGLSTIPQYLHSICCVLAVEGRGVEITRVTHLYVWVFISFLRQHFQNYAEKRAYEILNDERLSTCIKLIAEVAYNLLLENKIVFDKDQFSEIDNKFNSNSREKEVLEVFINKKETEFGYYYEFKHLTLHEFFAAIHCFHTNVAMNEIIKKRWNQVFLFVVGFSSAAQRNQNFDIVSLFLSSCVKVENTPDKRSLILEFRDNTRGGTDLIYQLQLIHEAFEVDERIGENFVKKFVCNYYESYILKLLTQLNIFHLLHFIHLVQNCNLSDLLADMRISLPGSTFSRSKQTLDLLSWLHLFRQVNLTFIEEITIDDIESLKNGIMKEESKLEIFSYWNKSEDTDKETFDAVIGCAPYIKNCIFRQLNCEQKEYLIEEINRCRHQKNFRFKWLTIVGPTFDHLEYGIDELNSIKTSD